MQRFWEKVRLIFQDPSLKKKIFFVLGALILFRFLATIPVPGIDMARLQALLEQSQFLGLLNIFSGGGLANLSIVMVGVGAYITASIIMQLLTVIVPKVKQLRDESGDAGRKKFAQYSRLLTVPLAFMQGFGLLTLLFRNGVLPQLTTFDMVVNVTVIAAGALLLMWIGELISEFGIGNGVSLIIFAGIVAGLPSTVSQLAFTFDPSQIPLYLGFTAFAVLTVAGVTLMTEAERPVPITYAKSARGMRQSAGGVSTYLPLRLNQAGVMPIIFALSILLFPQMIITFLSGMDSAWIQSVSSVFLKFFENGILYSSAYFALVFLFTFFYTAIMFDPENVASNLQKNGAFIPGVRPGAQTAEYLGKIVTRITFVGAVFLSVIAVLPLALQAVTGNTALAIGGTALLIVVSVVLDLIKKIDAQIAMREY